MNNMVDVFMKKVAIIGTVGIPANYGGFETLVENLVGENCPDNVKYTVYCSGKSYKSRKKEYKEAKLVYIPLKANGVQSTLYDIFSMIHAAFTSDVMLILGVSGCMFLPILRLFFWKKIIVNIDGLEHRRQKWGKFTKWFLKKSEAIAVRFANLIVTDNKAIQDYVTDEYDKRSVLIEYGGDHVICDTSKKEEKVLNQYVLNKHDYSFTVCRIEPENNIHVILEAFSKSSENLVMVGNWTKSSYGVNLLNKYEGFANIKMLTPIYDLERLNVFRCNCKYYIHGHSAGGTNPSLVEAMFFARPVIAFDVVYNRETTENRAVYFKDADSLLSVLTNQNSAINYCGDVMLEIAEHRYLWNTIAGKYNRLYHKWTNYSLIQQVRNNRRELFYSKKKTA